MTAHEKFSEGEGSIRSDKAGKVFRAIITPEVSLRECLGCGELFSREASREHAEVPCYLTKRTIETFERG